MKKMLAFASALVIASGAMAQCSPTVTTTYGQVYKLTMSLKTTKGYLATGTTGNVCAPGTSCTIYREKDSISVCGWIYDCTRSCDLIATGTTVAWETKRKTQILNPTFTWAFVNVMGRKQTYAEGAWTFAGDLEYDTSRKQTLALTGAGIGSYSEKNGYFTSLSGNVAGTMTASYDLKTKKSESCTCDPSQIWKCADLATLVDSDTVAYGTWSMKYNSAASKKYGANGSLTVPSYVTFAK